MYLLFDGDYIDVLAVVDDASNVYEIILENEERNDCKMIEMEISKKGSEWTVFEVFYEDSEVNGTNKYNLIKVEINKLI